MAMSSVDKNPVVVTYNLKVPFGINTALQKAICYAMLSDSELPTLVLTGNEALERHDSAFAKY